MNTVLHRTAALVAVILSATLLSLAASPATAAPASASAGITIELPTSTEALTASASCGGGRCTIYFSKAETAAIGRGSIPAPPGALPIPLKAAYYALGYVHKWIAADYARRGMCSGFQLSIFPWETQGYFGYRC